MSATQLFDMVGLATKARSDDQSVLLVPVGLMKAVLFGRAERTAVYLKITPDDVAGLAAQQTGDVGVDFGAQLRSRLDINTAADRQQAGRMVRFVPSANGLRADGVRWSADAARMIAGGEYRYVVTLLGRCDAEANRLRVRSVSLWNDLHAIGLEDSSAYGDTAAPVANHGASIALSRAEAMKQAALLAGAAGALMQEHYQAGRPITSEAAIRMVACALSRGGRDAA